MNYFEISYIERKNKFFFNGFLNFFDYEKESFNLIWVYLFLLFSFIIFFFNKSRIGLGLEFYLNSGI